MKSLINFWFNPRWECSSANPSDLRIFKIKIYITFQGVLIHTPLLLV